MIENSCGWGLGDGAQKIAGSVDRSKGLALKIYRGKGHRNMST
jgi:hypothetical protein